VGGAATFAGQLRRSPIRSGSTCLTSPRVPESRLRCQTLFDDLFAPTGLRRTFPQFLSAAKSVRRFKVIRGSSKAGTGRATYLETSRRDVGPPNGTGSEASPDQRAAGSGLDEPPVNPVTRLFVQPGRRIPFRGVNEGGGAGTQFTPLYDVEQFCDPLGNGTPSTRL
jgi:hypothetical protein